MDRRDPAPGIQRAIASARYFESLATFYRKGYMRWMEDAKRPETRAKRIQEAVVALKAPAGALKEPIAIAIPFTPVER